MDFPPLAIKWNAPVSIIEKYGLTVEAGTEMIPEAGHPAAQYVTSAHAPYYLPEGGRLNIASIDKDFRAVSIQHVKDFISMAKSIYLDLKEINMHAAPKRWNEPGRELPAIENISEWNILLDSFREIGDYVKEFGVTICVENNRFYWAAAGGEHDVDKLDFSTFQLYFCCDPREWLKLGQEIGHPAVSLTLDPSHASSWCQTKKTEDERRDELLVFQTAIEQGYVSHVHWNDSVLDTVAGREDLHLCIGEGNLGRELHSIIKQLGIDGKATLLLEHWYDEDRLVKELEFIESL